MRRLIRLISSSRRGKWLLLLAFPLLFAGLAVAAWDRSWVRLSIDPRDAEPIPGIPRHLLQPRPREPEARPPRPDWLDSIVRLEYDIPYAGDENPIRRLDLLLPKAPKGDRPLPVVVYIHGGAWMSGDKSMGHRMLADLVVGGEYAGVSIDYRLTHQGAWPAQIHDCKAAIRWVRANAAKYGLDPDRIGVRGESAGGHLVSMLGTSGGVAELEGELGEHRGVSSRVQCVVDEYSPSELLALDMSYGPIDRPERRLVGGQFEGREDVVRSASPITHVSSDDPPFLIIHGTDDRTVPFDQAKRLHAALGAAGADGLLLQVEGGGHGGWTNPEVPRRIRLFYEKHLLGRDVPVSGGSLPNDPTTVGVDSRHH